MKDNFSANASEYAKYRPQYPQELYDFILSFVPERKLAWDCGTGNGQTATELAKYFENVYASDISRQQLHNAVKQSNILYRQEPAEQSALESGSVNMISVSQALHWFHFEEFYKEVKRVAAPDAIIAAWIYNLFKADDITNKYIDNLYWNTLKNYWDNERHYVDEDYKNIPFPFESIPNPGFSIKLKWTAEDLEGYLGTWSAVQKFKKLHNVNPVNTVARNIKQHWPPNEIRLITFPISLKMAYVNLR
ncbi:MAG: class I SAM-dependent methyltransferase [Ferruginibacter sp.]